MPDTPRNKTMSVIVSGNAAGGISVNFFDSGTVFPTFANAGSKNIDFLLTLVQILSCLILGMKIF